MKRSLPRPAYVYKVIFDPGAEKEFLKLDTQAQSLVTSKVLDLKRGNFANDKSLQGKHKGKYRKRAGNYRIVYLRENSLLLISVIRVAHRKEVY